MLFILQLVSIPLFLCSILIEGKTFSKISYCQGCDGCSWHKAFFTLRASEVQLQSVSTKPTSIHEVPLLVRCAYWCQLNDSCMGFDYEYVDGICSFFKIFSYKIYPKENCVYYEAKEDSSKSVGKPRKSCQSSAAIQNGVVLGAWEVETFGSHCAQTDEPPSGSNWWMFDMERYFTLSYITIWTGDSNSLDRLIDLAVGMTNTSWLAGDPLRSSYSICTVVTDKLLPYTYYNMHCRTSIVPGRYLVIQQGALDPKTTGYFALCGFRAG